MKPADQSLFAVVIGQFCHSQHILACRYFRVGPRVMKSPGNQRKIVSGYCTWNIARNRGQYGRNPGILENFAVHQAEEFSRAWLCTLAQFPDYD